MLRYKWPRLTIVHGGQVLLAIEYMVLNVNNYNLENTITAMLIKVPFLSTKEREKVETRDFIVIIKKRICKCVVFHKHYFSYQSLSKGSHNNKHA